MANNDVLDETDIIIRDKCLICNSQHIVVDYQIGHRKIGHCRECGFSFVVQYSLSSLAKCYDEDYYPKGKPEVYFDWIKQNISVWRQLCYDIPNSSFERMLDIGTGTGGFLQVFHELHPQTEIYATEPSVSARNFLSQYQSYGHYYATPDSIDINLSFDMISLLQVLEHIHDPSAMCDTIYSKLHKNGCLLLTIPNRYSYDAIMHPIKNTLCYGNSTHLQFFRACDIVLLLKKSGFKQIKRIASFGSEMCYPKQVLQYLMRRIGISSELRFIAIR